MIRLVWLVLALAGLVWPGLGLTAGEHVMVLRVTGVINPAVAAYVDRGVGEAEADGSAALLIEMDTPGGLDTAMRQIVQRMVASKVPVIVYVWPQGARAASAGLFIAEAAGVAAMAPSTNIGAAHPVGLAPATGASGASADSTMSAKVENDAVAYIRALATSHGRNADWAEQAVRQSVSVPADEAVKLHVVDLVAASPEELLRAVDGREVPTGAGNVTLHAAGLPLRPVEMSLIERFLHGLAEPNVAYVLMTLGIYGMIFELSSPGAILPGVAGGICLLLGLIGLGMLSVSYGGLALIAFAFVLFVADVLTPTHGVLTAGGLASLLIGSLMLMRGRDPALAISLPVILAVVGLTGLFFAFVVGSAVRAHFWPVTTGKEGMIGAEGVARQDLAPRGTVFVAGELWQAVSDNGAIHAGEPVRVLAVEGLRLRVRKAPGIVPKGVA